MRQKDILNKIKQSSKRKIRQELFIRNLRTLNSENLIIWDYVILKGKNQIEYSKCVEMRNGKFVKEDNGKYET